MAEMLGGLLVRRGVIKPAQLEEGLQAQRARGGRLGTNLIELEYLDLYTLPRYLAEQRGMPVVGADEFEELGEGSLGLVPKHVAVEHCAVPLRVEGGRLVVAMAAAWDPAAVDALERALRSPIIARLAAELHVLRAIERRYRVRVREPPPKDPDGFLTREEPAAEGAVPEEPDTSQFARLESSAHLTTEEDDLYLKTGGRIPVAVPSASAPEADPPAPVASTLVQPWRPQVEPELPVIEPEPLEEVEPLEDDGPAPEARTVDAAPEPAPEPDPLLEPPPDPEPLAPSLEADLPLELEEGEPPAVGAPGPDWVIEADGPDGPGAPAGPSAALQDPRQLAEAIAAADARARAKTAGPSGSGPVPPPKPQDPKASSDDWVIEAPAEE